MFLHFPSLQLFYSASQATNDILHVPARCAPDPVINRVTTPNKWPYTWQTGVISLLSGVITLLMAGFWVPCGSLDVRMKGWVQKVDERYERLTHEL